MLLILAAVAINLTIGNDGIFTRAQTAVEENIHATVKENFTLKQNQYEIDKALGHNESFIDYLKSSDGGNILNNNNEVNVENLVGSKQKLGNGTNHSDVYVVESDDEINYILRYYDKNGEHKDILEFVGGRVIDWDEIFSKAKKHPDQSSENNTIGIDSNGNPVNMDLWISTKMSDGYNLNGKSGSGTFTSYLGEYTENGEIVGKIPQYIKKDTDDKFYPVVSMEYTFANEDRLKIAPEIPNTVTSMHGTFYGCDYLIKITNLPENVMDMSYTFYSCDSLAIIPELPPKLSELDNTFANCGLPIILPDNVNKIIGNWYVIILKDSKRQIDMEEADVAEIIYKEDAISYKDFATNYIKDLDETQIKKNIMTSFLFFGMPQENFESALEVVGLSSEGLKLYAEKVNLTYEEVLKEIYIYDMVLAYSLLSEYYIYLTDLDIPNDVEELKEKIAEIANVNSFDEYLQSTGTSEEEFNTEMEKYGADEKIILKVTLAGMLTN